MRLRTTMLYVCFFLSGASALTYEIVWQRQLTLVFGLSTYSVAAVLAAFFAGLALGARVFARAADASPRPGRLYAAVELGVALTGAASAFVVPLVTRAFVSIFPHLPPGWLASNLARFVLAFAGLCVPCVLIGATVPLMARLATASAGRVALGFGRFYAVNTLGGLLGAAAAGFALIRFLGVQTTLYCAVAGNVLAALIALAAAGPGAPDAVEPDAAAAAPAGPAHRHERFALTLAAVCGFLALAYEVVWIRLLAVYTLNSVYVFTMVVAVYLAALAIGTALAARLVGKHGWDPARTLAGVQLLLTLLAPCLLIFMPAASDLDIAHVDAAERTIFLSELALTGLVVFVPTVLLGLTLPLLVALFSADTAHAGRTVGRIYAFNSLGTIAGAALPGALLVPLVGLRGTILLLAAISMATAAAATLLDEAPRHRRVWLPVGAAVFVLLMALTPATGQFRLPLAGPEDVVLYYAEGPSATVHVVQVNGPQDPARQIFVDSKSVAGTYPEIVTDQKMLAHLPLLLHPDPELALTVGFGTGGTSYSMLQHLIWVHCVEIEPAVPAAAHWFESENGGMVGAEHERVDFHLILDDARAWLNVAPKPYDAIVTDVTSIQYRGNGNLYTTDYFRLMQRRLASGGIAAAWVPISGITPEQLRILVGSFQAVYPHTSVWYMLNLPTDFVILVGTEERLHLPMEAIAERMQAKLVARDLAAVGMENPYKLATCLLLAEEDVAAYVGDEPLHTDDRPVLDYLTHASPYRATLAENLRALIALRSDPAQYFSSLPPAESVDASLATWQRWYAASQHLLEGHILLNEPTRDRFDRARVEYEAAVKLVPEDAYTRLLIEKLGLHE